MSSASSRSSTGVATGAFMAGNLNPLRDSMQARNAAARRAFSARGRVQRGPVMARTAAKKSAKRTTRRIARTPQDAARRTRPALVEARDRDERRARPEGRRVHVARSEEDRGLAEALRRAQQAAQGEPLSFGALDADLLHQPRRQEPAGLAPQGARPCEGRTEGSNSTGIDRARGSGLSVGGHGERTWMRRRGRKPGVLSADAGRRIAGARVLADVSSRLRHHDRGRLAWRLPHPPRVQRKIPAARAARSPARP